MKETTLGPVVSLASAERIRKQVADASKSRIYYYLCVVFKIDVQFRQGQRH